MRSQNLDAAVSSGISMKKTILKLAWPVVFEHSLATLTQIVDMMMVGRLGAVAIAAIGLTIQPLLFATAVGSAISVGTTTLVARAFGANDYKQGGRVLGQSLLSGGLVALVVAFIFFVFSKEILELMGGEPEVAASGSSYLRILVPGFVFMFIGFVITAALRGAGDTVTPMKVNIVINVFNVIGNYILIFGRFGIPAMGLNGAALATSIVRSLGGIALFVHILRKTSTIHMNIRGFFRVRLDVIRRVINIGFPAAMEQIVMRIAQIIFVRIVAGLGTVAFAAHQIAINAESISYMPGFGIAVAATTLVGQNLGADRPDRAERSAYESWKLGACIMGCMAVVFWLVPQYLIMLFTDEQEIIALGAANLRIIAFAQLPMAMQFIFAGALRGAGDTRSVFYSTAIASWVGRLGLAYIFVYLLDWGLSGAWLAMVIDWTLRGGAVYLVFRRGRWKMMKV